MENNRSVWLILEKSDETRVSNRTQSYEDVTGKIYNYDSLVANYKNLKKDDLVIIRKENDILGIGTISTIESSPSLKVHLRCPKCNATDIRSRKNLKPEWRCGKCSLEFDDPAQTESSVTAYTAGINGFAKFNRAPSVDVVKTCALKGDGSKHQNSIMALDFEKVNSLVPTIEQSTKSKSPGQGLGLSAKERKAVELRAMEVVTDLYETKGWRLIDTSLSRPYDFEAYKDDEVRYIEVKGTTGDGNSVILTHGEVNHAQQNPKESILVVVSNIELDRSSTDPKAFGGSISTHEDPWVVEEERLLATQYRYGLY